MPTVKPSDKTGHEGEWWKKDKKDREPTAADPEYDRHNNLAEIRENQFNEAEHPVINPT